MKDQLTMIVALPQAGGCQSALPPERIEAKKPEITAPVEWKIPEEMLAWPSIVFLDEEPGC